MGGRSFGSVRGVRSLLPLLAAVSLLAMLPAGPSRGAASSAGSTSAPTAQTLARTPLSFIQNRGQLDPRVSYYLRGRDTSTFFTSHGVTLTMPDASGQGRSVLRLRFPGSRPVSPVGAERLPGTVSYFIGHQGNWHTGIATFGRILYPNLWSGIDLEFSGTQSRLEYSFVVHPGADPSAIQVAYAGSTSLSLAGGNLNVATPAGPITELAPWTFQPLDGRDQRVASTYRILGQHRFGFDLGRYDPSSFLVIDPTVLVYSGFLGGSKFDFGTSIAVDAAQDAFVTGYTDSINFPAMTGPDTAKGAGYDAFVAKVDPAGTLVYSGFIGGSGDDFGNAIAVDAAGNAYVTGSTTSSSDFPLLGGPVLTFGGKTDAFVSAVKADGTGLIYSGYNGGPGTDIGWGIGVDSAGNAYVTGTLDNFCGGSRQASVPDAAVGGVDVLLDKISPTGAPVSLSCYGGSDFDAGYALTVDAAGNAYITGLTFSGDFLVSAGSPAYGDNGDAFVTQWNSGLGLVYSRYLGGPGFEQGNWIAADGSGNAYVTGWTTSPEFPHVVGPDLSYNGGFSDAFAAEIGSGGASLVFSGFVGGGSSEFGDSISVAPNGNVVVAGETYSLDFPVSVVGGQRVCGAGFDAFDTAIAPGGRAIAGSTLLAGGGGGLVGVTVGSSGDTFLTGSTPFSFFQHTKGPDLSFNGKYDGYVARVGLATGGAISEPGLIDFVSDRGNKADLLDLWTTTSDGACQYVTQFPQGHVSNAPAWSPDTSKIAFTATVKKNTDIYLESFTERSIKFLRLTKEKKVDREPAWSPDGEHIAFASDEGNPSGQYDIWVMDADGKHAHPLKGGGGPLAQEAPAWSPNGKTILFQGLDLNNGHSRIYSVKASGGKGHPITSGPDDKFPDWAPDGSRVAFQRSDQIYTMNPTGSGIKKLPHQPKALNFAPAWSPEGDRIAFFSNKSGNDDIFVINANGTHLQQLSRDKSREDFPRWEPAPGASGSAASVLPSMKLDVPSAKWAPGAIRGSVGSGRVLGRSLLIARRDSLELPFGAR
jgi:hypothetical protein